MILTTFLVPLVLSHSLHTSIKKLEAVVAKNEVKKANKDIQDIVSALEVVASKR